MMNLNSQIENLEYFAANSYQLAFLFQTLIKNFSFFPPNSERFLMDLIVETLI